MLENTMIQVQRPVLPKKIRGDESYALAQLACKNFKKAYILAAKLKSVEIIKAIRDEARRMNDHKQVELCEIWLTSHLSPGHSYANPTVQ